jgi:hypothetical protein
VEESLKQSAEDFVAKLLSYRLESGGIPTDAPELYFQCQADDPQEYPGGFQVRVHTWRHWSNARVLIASNSGEIIGFSIDRYAYPENNLEMTKEKALDVVSKLISIPTDAVLNNFYHFDYMTNHRIAKLEWNRIYKGLKVVGDYLQVSIHPETHRIVEYACKWRKLKLT